ncbi:MAG: efflux transporter outer membrane subunit [Verrucomicrobia bacterium]|jgi:NodT family efflux transporter outer membrane factor (OMF) lipoprotein|nr:efflux transporter outer membrane subunit [Verrucomicrobiota bacterium]
MNRRFQLLVATLLLASAGCRVGPRYHPPETAVPAAWTGTGSGTTTNNPAGLAQWWRTLNDPTLDSLIERAVKSNYDLQAATARVRTARALRGVVASEFIPTIGAGASYNTTRRSENAITSPVRSLDTETYQAGFDASWEMDVFGGKRRSWEAATAGLQAVEDQQRGVRVSLLAEVARNYIELRGSQKRLQIAQENLASQQEVVTITQMRFDKGLATELEVAQAKALRAATRAQVPTLETAVKQASHRLSVLLGEPPGSLDAELAQTGRIPVTPPEVPAGLPSDLLLRRPDVRASERQLAAATAQIGVAEAELFPKFFLTGIAGFQSLEAGTLFSPDSQFWTAGPSVRWRILEYPRLKAQVNAQTAQQEESLARFNQTVLTSLEEVENALVAYGKEKERYRSLTEAVDSTRRSLDLADQLYTAGIGDFLNVLITQRALYEAEDALVQSERTVTSNLVALYKALGGGWDAQAGSP